MNHLHEKLHTNQSLFAKGQPGKRHIAILACYSAKFESKRQILTHPMWANFFEKLIAPIIITTVCIIFSKSLFDRYDVSLDPSSYAERTGRITSVFAFAEGHGYDDDIDSKIDGAEGQYVYPIVAGVVLKTPWKPANGCLPGKWAIKENDYVDFIDHVEDDSPVAEFLYKFATFAGGEVITEFEPLKNILNVINVCEPFLQSMEHGTKPVENRSTRTIKTDPCKEIPKPTVKNCRYHLDSKYCICKKDSK